MTDITDRIASRAGSAVTVRVYAPSDPEVALLWVHGGGFRGGSLDMPEADWVARRLADRGTLVASVDYRLVTDVVRYPDPSDDVLTAWELLLAHSEGLLAHMGGASAGANLALGAALRLRDAAQPAPRSIVLAYPTLHADQRDAGPGLARRIAELPADQRWDRPQRAAMYERFLPRAPKASAAYASPGDVDPAGLPPVLIVASDVDGLRPSAEAYAESLAASAVPHSIQLENGSRHGHLNRPDEPYAIGTIERIADWIGSTSGASRSA